MKHLITVLLLFSFGFACGSTNAETTAFSFKYQGWDRYHGANGSEFDPELSNQLSLFAQHGSGYYAAVWLGTDLDGKADFGNEVDLNIGKVGQRGALDYDVGVQYFFIHQPTSESGDVVNLYVGLSKGLEAENWVHNAYIRWDNYFSVGGDLPDNGNIVKFGVAMTRQLNNQWSLTFDPHLKVDDGAFGFDSNLLGFIDGSLTYKFSETQSLSLLGRFSEPLREDSRRTDLTTFGFQWLTQF